MIFLLKCQCRCAIKGKSLKIDRRQEESSYSGINYEVQETFFSETRALMGFRGNNMF